MNEEAGFISTLIAQPDDETVRGAYADWLDDRGDEASRWRAKMIRGQWDAFEGSRDTISLAFPELEPVIEECSPLLLVDSVTYDSGDGPRGPRIEITRGFLSACTLPFATFLDQAGAFGRHPLKTIRLTGIVPDDTTPPDVAWLASDAKWWGLHHGELPTALFFALPVEDPSTDPELDRVQLFDTRNEAMEWLYLRAAAYSRAEAARRRAA